MSTEQMTGVETGSGLRPCSLSDVARVAKVSLSTASLALRDSPRVLPKTKERIHTVATQLGYRPDLRLASSTARIGRNITLRDPEQLAFVSVGTRRTASRNRVALAALREGAVARAEQLGCGLAEFWPDEDGMTPRRLEQILRARGTTEVIFSAPSCDTSVGLDWDWTHFAGVVIGEAVWTPNLHCVAHNHYRSMWTTLDRPHREGCVRPAAIPHRPFGRRVDSMQWAAFIGNHPQPKIAQHLMCSDTPAELLEVSNWLRRIEVDALALAFGQDSESLHILRENQGVLQSPVSGLRRRTSARGGRAGAATFQLRRMLTRP